PSSSCGKSNGYCKAIKLGCNSEIHFTEVRPSSPPLSSTTTSRESVGLPSPGTNAATSEAV
nr:hypothetical protein [Tanacetum cinerariifolium]